MSYRLLIEENAVREIGSITKKDQERIKTKIKNILTEDPTTRWKRRYKKDQ